MVAQVGGKHHVAGQRSHFEVINDSRHRLFVFHRRDDISGRNWLWRQMVISAIRQDPDWHEGRYTSPPTQWLRVMPIFAVLTVNPVQLQHQAPNRETAAQLYETLVKQAGA